MCFVLGAAMRVSAALVIFTPTVEALLTISLSAQRVPVFAGGRQVATKTAYFGDIFVGLPAPQRFTVVFDTGSGHVFLPSASCKAETCLSHKRYDTSLSHSAVSIDHDGSMPFSNDMDDRDQVSISYGTGQIVGPFAHDTVCISAPLGSKPPQPLTSLPKADHCVRVRVVEATKMSEEPFKHFLFDGVIGLGLSGLALHPDFHFFSQMTASKAISPIFSFFIARDERTRSQITFGGLDETRMAGPMRYVSVTHPENGHWRVAIRKVSIGNMSLPQCDDGSCTAIVDTGTSILGVPHEAVTTVISQTSREVAALEPSDGDMLDCRTVAGPPLIFEMEDGLIVQLDSEDYTRPAPVEVIQSHAQEKDDDTPPENVQFYCRASVLPIDMPPLGRSVFLWGEPVLMKYYTSYDVAKNRIGFAPVA